MPEDAPLNGGASPWVDWPGLDLAGARRRVSGMQAKLHCWAVADAGRRFDDLFNFVHDPATLLVAFARVAGNRGGRTAGVDGLTAASVAERRGVPGFLDDLRTDVKAGQFRPLPVRERMIPQARRVGEASQVGDSDGR
jgi:RNA-directed DNA polymerase